MGDRFFLNLYKLCITSSTKYIFVFSILKRALTVNSEEKLQLISAAHNRKNVTIDCYISSRNVTMLHFWLEFTCHIIPHNLATPPVVLLKSTNENKNWHQLKRYSGKLHIPHLSTGKIII